MSPGVWPCRFAASCAAPCSRRTSMTSSWFRPAARCSGVSPFALARSRAAPRASRSRTMSTCPLIDAWWRAVQPSVLCRSTCRHASSRISSSTTAVRPLALARCRAVSFRDVVAATDRGREASREPSTASCPFSAARWTGCTPCASASVRSAPTLTRYSTTARWPPSAARCSGVDPSMPARRLATPPGVAPPRATIPSSSCATRRRSPASAASCTGSRASYTTSAGPARAACAAYTPCLPITSPWRS